jgi:hypothetical protein
VVHLCAAGWKSVERLKALKTQMTEALPLVAEANAMARALAKPVQLSLRLLPVRGLFCIHPSGVDGSKSAEWSESCSPEELRQRFDREVRTCVLWNTQQGLCADLAHVCVCVCVAGGRFREELAH